jgi:hypothetical protein
MFYIKTYKPIIELDLKKYSRMHARDHTGNQYKNIVRPILQKIRLSKRVIF